MCAYVCHAGLGKHTLAMFISMATEAGRDALINSPLFWCVCMCVKGGAGGE